MKIVIVTTGGTIAMRLDPELGVVPAVNGAELVAAVPGLGEYKIEVVEFSNIPSPHMTPGLMFQLSQLADAWLAREGVAGVVVTHGTDTLEETAYFLDMCVQSNKPVVVTGAMRSGGDLSADGPSNLLCAVQVAACPESVGRGTLVVLNEEIHAARDVRKSHAGRLHTFVSPVWGALGEVDEDGLVYRRSVPARTVLSPGVPEYNVHLVACAAGSSPLVMDLLLAHGVRGLVLEGFGRGNVPAELVPSVQAAVAAGVPVVLTSRVFSGRVLPTYGYPGGARTLYEAGVISGGELPGHKARLRLMLAMGLTRNMQELNEYFRGC